jgi:hypothetical protein
MALIQGGMDLAFGQMDDRGYTWSMRSRSDFIKGVDRKIGMYNDPTYLGFFLLFQPNSPLLNTTDAPGSAYYYLNKIGEKTRAKLVLALSDIIRDINHNMPWYWQSITGLENAYKWKDMKEPYMGGGDAKITISTLESIDLKITQVMELYRRIVYDMDYRREILPVNLRKFRMWVWVQEIRKFKIDRSLLAMGANALGYTGIGGTLDKKADETARIVNENSPWMLFQLDMCEFMPDESAPFLATLSFSEPTPASNSISIKYENLKYDFGPNLGTDLAARLNALDEEPDTFVDRMKAKMQEMATNAAVNIAQEVENMAVNAVTGFVTNLYLGNVHGFSVSGALDMIQQSSVSAITGKISNAMKKEGANPGPNINENTNGPRVISNNQLSGHDNVNG